MAQKICQNSSKIYSKYLPKIAQDLKYFAKVANFRQIWSHCQQETCKENCSKMLPHTCLERSDWFKILAQPIRMLKNGDSVNFKPICLKLFQQKEMNNLSLLCICCNKCLATLMQYLTSWIEIVLHLLPMKSCLDQH